MKTLLGPMLLSEDMEQSAKRMPPEVVCAEAIVGYQLLLRLTSRWKHRRRVETRWPVIPLATYCLILDKHCRVPGRYEQIIKRVARLSGWSQETVEGMCHQDVLEAMGTLPPFLMKENW